MKSIKHVRHAQRSSINRAHASTDGREQARELMIIEDERGIVGCGAETAGQEFHNLLDDDDGEG